MAKKNIPKNIQISAFNFKVQRDQSYLDTQKEDLDGLSEFGKQLITVGKAPPDYTADTLLHEVLHQCLRVVGFPLDDEEVKLEERIVTTMTPILLDTLRRNPKVVRYLLDE